MKSTWPLLVTLMACAAPDPSVAPGATLPGNDTVDDVDTDASTDSDAPVVSPLSCEANLAWLQPDDDAQHVPLNARVTAGFTKALPASAEGWDLYIEGVPGSVSVSSDGLVAGFVPEAPLLHDTDYTVVTRVCDTQVTGTFRTVKPPIDLNTIDGASWFVNTDDVQWLAPSASSVFLPVLNLPDFLIGTIEQEDGLHLIARPAIFAGRLAPMPCAPTLDFGVLDLSDNPLFHSTAHTLTFSWFGSQVQIDGVVAEGSFSDNGDTLTGLAFEGSFDTRDLEDVTGLNGLCLVAAQLGEPCQPCPDGEPACMRSFVTYDLADGVSINAHQGSFDPFDLCD